MTQTALDFTRPKPDAPEGDKEGEDLDEKYDEAVELVTDLGQASISLVQRYLKVGYNRAARIIERMEAEGVVGPSDGVKPRKVLARKLMDVRADADPIDRSRVVYRLVG